MCGGGAGGITPCYCPFVGHFDSAFTAEGGEMINGRVVPDLKAFRHDRLCVYRNLFKGHYHRSGQRLMLW